MGGAYVLTPAAGGKSSMKAPVRVGAQRGKLTAGGHVSTLPPTHATAALVATPVALPRMIALTANARVAEALAAREGRPARAGRALESPGSFAMIATAPLARSAALATSAITRILITAAPALTTSTASNTPPRSAILVISIAATASALTLGPPAHSQSSELPSKEVVATIRLRGPGMDGHGPLNLT